MFSPIKCVGALALSAASLTTLTCNGAEIYNTLPKQINADQHYVFYSHGYIVEGTNATPVSPRWGTYEFPKIKQALSDSQYTLIATHRANNTDPLAYATKLSADIKTLVSSGVSYSNISIIGFSRGGEITALVANQLANSQLNTIILAGCSEFLTANPQVQLYGKVLSIFETSDGVGSCQFVVDRSPHIDSFKEIAISTGKEHGAFYTPLPQWLTPVKQWLKRTR